MSKADEVFKEALVGKKIPILVLDNKWHQLFTQAEYTSQIKGMEDELNKLLKRQGKVNTDCKDAKTLKKKMMDDIVILADQMGHNPTKKQDKQMEELKQKINECNEKIDACEEEMVELPRQINQLNNKLMLVTMEVCYQKLQKNTAELEEIEEWISGVRRELKKKVVRKQEKEAMNFKLYSYMHDIFGTEVIDLFDMKYNPEDRKKKDDKPAQEQKQEQNKTETNDSEDAPKP